MSNKYSEFEQNLNPGSHLLNLDDETWKEVNEYLVSGKGDELLVAVSESLKSGEFEFSDNETEESDEEKCLYGELNGDGIYYSGKGSKAFVRQNPRSADDNSAWPGPPIAFTRSK